MSQSETPECFEEIVRHAKERAKTCVEAIQVSGSLVLSNGKAARYWTVLDQDRKPKLQWEIK